ncbi:MAG: class I SAM-dependent methyltransferase [Acidobacteria bacterium]|nr:class I SAM-dependent methyltransferase [Acidobacteriota bacterium]
MRRPEFIAKLARFPSGLLGRLLARLMAAETARENAMALQLLDLQADDSVLEIGFGHGKTLGRAAQAVERGFLAGLDPSHDMCRMATRRHQGLIAQGRLELKLGDSRSIPYEDRRFAKIFSVNTIYFWSDPAQDLREIRRVLKRGGRFVLGFHPTDDRVLADFPASVYRFYSREEVRSLLQNAGFEEIRIAELPDPDRNFLFAVARGVP